MKQLRPILRALVVDGRWRRSLALAVAFAVGCGLLSWWQFARRQETAEANALIVANAAAAPRALADVLPSRHAYRPDQQWLTVRMEGTYLTGDQLLVRNRVHDDAPGFEVVTPFRLADGSVFVLDRGWVPIGTQPRSSTNTEPSASRNGVTTSKPGASSWTRLRTSSWSPVRYVPSMRTVNHCWSGR